MNPVMFISQLSQCSLLLTLVNKLKQMQSYQEQLTLVYSLTKEAAKWYMADNFY